MKANDTIMTDTDVKNFIGYWDAEHAEDIRLIKSRQAKISFRAGQKEVVEWIKQEIDKDIFDGDAKIALWVCKEDWQAKLEDWGIDED